MENYRILFRSVPVDDQCKSNYLSVMTDGNQIGIDISTIKHGEKMEGKYVVLSRETAIKLCKELKRQIGNI